MSERFVAARMGGLVQSDIRRLTIECEKVGGINLGQGICDLPTHPLVAEGAIAAIKANQATYTHAMGLIELRRKISQKLQEFNGLNTTPRPNSALLWVRRVHSPQLFRHAGSGLRSGLDRALLRLPPEYAALAGVTPRYAPMDLPGSSWIVRALKRRFHPRPVHWFSARRQTRPASC